MGSTVAGNAANRDQLLAEAIPAQSLSIGSHETEALEERNYDLPALFADIGWPGFVVNACANGGIATCGKLPTSTNAGSSTNS